MVWRSVFWFRFWVKRIQRTRCGLCLACCFYARATAGPLSSTLFYIRSRIDSTERRSPRWGWLGFLCPTYYSFRVHAFEGGPHEGALSYVLRPSSRISYHADSAQTLLRAAANATRTPLCARLTGSTVELGSVVMAAQMRTQEIKCYAATFRG